MKLVTGTNTCVILRSPYPHCPVFLYRTLSCNDVSGRHGSWCCDSISDSVALGFRWRNILFAFCHIQRVGDIPVVRDTSVFCHLQVIVVEYEMHVIFVSPVAGEQATVEEGCGLILVKPPAIQVIYVESKPQSFVCIDGKIGFEAFFSVTAASSFVIAQVREWRKCIGEYDIFRTLYAKVVWVGEKVLAGIRRSKRCVRGGGTQISQVIVLSGVAAHVI